MGRLPRELVRDSSAVELAALEFWYRKEEAQEGEKNWYMLNRALGTLWEQSDLEKPKSEKAFKEKVWYPLSLLLAQSDIMKFIKRDLGSGPVGGGEYVPEEGERIGNLSKQLPSKEDFKDFMSKFTAGTAGAVVAAATGEREVK